MSSVAVAAVPFASSGYPKGIGVLIVVALIALVGIPMYFTRRRRERVEAQEAQSSPDSRPDEWRSVDGDPKD